jgi:hypothetical protein
LIDGDVSYHSAVMVAWLVAPEDYGAVLAEFPGQFLGFSDGDAESIGFVVFHVFHFCHFLLMFILGSLVSQDEVMWDLAVVCDSPPVGPQDR